MRSMWALAALAAAALSLACGHDFDPPDRGARVRAAERAYTPMVFDSVVWPNDSVRAFEGNAVYVEKCRRCHGTLGSGDTEYARARGLEVPSLTEADWPLASLDTLRRVIFVGHEEGMPIYGASGITPREMDASAAYILDTLRPEVLGRDAG